MKLSLAQSLLLQYVCESLLDGQRYSGRTRAGWAGERLRGIPLPFDLRGLAGGLPPQILGITFPWYRQH